MDYCIVEDGKITNIIVCEDEETAAQFGALPSYDGAAIGETYAPPEPEPTYTAEDLLKTLLGG